MLAGIALSSFAALLLELALTRLFSVVLFYHFAFVAISIALLGLGAGGVCAYLSKSGLARMETRTLLARLSTTIASTEPSTLEAAFIAHAHSTVFPLASGTADDGSLDKALSPMGNGIPMANPSGINSAPPSSSRSPSETTLQPYKDRCGLPRSMFPY